MTRYRFVRRGPAWHPEYDSLLADPDSLLARQDTLVVTGGVRTVARVRVNGTALAIKVFDESDLLHRLENAFIGSSARRVARGIRLMTQAGLRAPALVAVLEKRRGITCVGSCIVSEWVQAGAQMQDVWSALRGAERYRLARAIGDYLRRLHGAGLYPQDTSANNILVWLDDHGTWQFVLVDLDRVRCYRSLSWHRRLKNLVQIHRSLARRARAGERLAFLHSYLGTATREQLDKVATEILLGSQRKDAEKVRARSAGR